MLNRPHLRSHRKRRGGEEWRMGMDLRICQPAPLPPPQTTPAFTRKGSTSNAAVGLCRRSRQAAGSGLKRSRESPLLQIHCRHRRGHGRSLGLFRLPQLLLMLLLLAPSLLLLLLSQTALVTPAAAHAVRAARSRPVVRQQQAEEFEDGDAYSGSGLIETKSEPSKTESSREEAKQEGEPTGEGEGEDGSENGGESSGSRGEGSGGGSGEDPLVQYRRSRRAKDTWRTPFMRVQRIRPDLIPSCAKVAPGFDPEVLRKRDSFEPITGLDQLRELPTGQKVLVVAPRFGLGNTLRNWVSAYFWALFSGRRIVVLHGGKFFGVYTSMCEAFNCAFDHIRPTGETGRSLGKEADKLLEELEHRIPHKKVSQKNARAALIWDEPVVFSFSYAFWDHWWLNNRTLARCGCLAVGGCKWGGGGRAKALHALIAGGPSEALGQTIERILRRHEPTRAEMDSSQRELNLDSSDATSRRRLLSVLDEGGEVSSLGGRDNSGWVEEGDDSVAHFRRRRRHGRALSASEEEEGEGEKGDGGDDDDGDAREEEGGGDGEDDEGSGRKEESKGKLKTGARRSKGGGRDEDGYGEGKGDEEEEGKGQSGSEEEVGGQVVEEVEYDASPDSTPVPKSSLVVQADELQPAGSGLAMQFDVGIHIRTRTRVLENPNRPFGGCRGAQCKQMAEEELGRIRRRYLRKVTWQCIGRFLRHVASLLPASGGGGSTTRGRAGHSRPLSLFLATDNLVLRNEFVRRLAGFGHVVHYNGAEVAHVGVSVSTDKGRLPTMAEFYLLGKSHVIVELDSYLSTFSYFAGLFGNGTIVTLPYTITDLRKCSRVRPVQKGVWARSDLGGSNNELFSKS